jgi:2,3,4,5-tetrahydropyridine-2-carboxylate N-succinyltransferase
MPPAYVNIGAHIGEGTMIDSHALVGTCAQIGARVHISAAAEIGGVLEPAGARPVIIEDDVMIGGNCGVYEGVVVRSRAVLGSGVVLNASTPYTISCMSALCGVQPSNHSRYLPVPL